MAEPYLEQHNHINHSVVLQDQAGPQQVYRTGSTGEQIPEHAFQDLVA